MKYVTCLLLLFCTLLGYGQQKSSLGLLPAYYIDSVKVSSMPLFDPNKIAAIDVIKDDPKQENRHSAIYITLSKPHDLNLLTLEEIAKKRIPAGTPCLFMIDNEIVKDVETVLIDSSYIFQYELLNTKDFKYLQALPALTILNIRVRTKANLDKEKSILIRGQQAGSFQFSLP
ncbi:MAG: hypothetical protein INR73_23705 [Williamsia sp.]|nr:hypothetical protein [Williamsia sp.]